MPANSNYDDWGSSNAARWLNKNFRDQVFDGRPLLAAFKERKATVTGGRTLLVPIREAQNTTNAWSTPYAQVDLTPQTGFSAAEYNWKIFFGSIVMSEAEKAWNRGEGAMINLWQAKFDQEVESAQNFLNTAIVSDGTNPLQLTGLEAAIAATGTYGNISRTSNTFWRAYVDSTSEALSVADLRDAILTASRNISKTDLIVTTQTLFTKMMTFFDSAYRVEDSRIAKLGFENIQLLGVPVTWDSVVPSGTVYGLNFDHIKLYAQEGWDMRWSDIRQPTRQLVDARIMRGMYQMASDAPRFLWALRNKTT